jgi:hypothetical protein
MLIIIIIIIAKRLSVPRLISSRITTLPFDYCSFGGPEVPHMFTNNMHPSYLVLGTHSLYAERLSVPSLFSFGITTLTFD